MTAQTHEQLAKHLSCLLSRALLIIPTWLSVEGRRGTVVKTAGSRLRLRVRGGKFEYLKTILKGKNMILMM